MSKRKLRYPGRSFVTSNTAALERRFEQTLPTLRKYPCRFPLIMHGIGLPDPLIGSRAKVPVEQPVRCRKCSECLKYRRALWTARAIDECDFAPRTWFGTLTVAPDHRFRLALAADLIEGHDQSSGLNEVERADLRFSVLVNLLGKEVTKMFDRLRARGHKFRYLLVAEAHSDGWPHFHLLLHEKVGRAPIRKEALRPAWALGFSQWKLAGEGREAALYVSKYLVKDVRMRIRASQYYGRPYVDRALTEAALEAATRFLDDPTVQKAETPPVPKGEKIKP